VHIVAMRPLFAQAAASHVFNAVGDRDSRVIAWVCAAAPYGGLRPVWTDMDVDPARKTFTVPYVTPATLAEGARIMPQFRHGGGADMTDREMVTFMRLLDHALAVCTEYDPISLSAARARAGHFISQDDIDAYALIWHEIAMFSAEHRDLRDSYVSPNTTSWAIEFLDARHHGTQPTSRGPHWYMFVSVTATIERMVADTPAALFQPHADQVFIGATVQDAICPTTVAGFAPTELCAAAADFARLVDAYAIMGVRGAADTRTVATVGQFLCAVREVLRRLPHQSARRRAPLDANRHMKEVLAAMRDAHVKHNGLSAPQFVRSVADTLHAEGLAGTFFELWDLWLPRFAEAALLTAARTAAQDPAFDARAQVHAVEPGSALHEFMYSQQMHSQ
jgi:hypothetical protein